MKFNKTLTAKLGLPLIIFIVFTNVIVLTLAEHLEDLILSPEELTQHIFTLTLLAVGFLCFSGYEIYLLKTHIFKPLSILKKSVQEISAGNYKVQVDLKSQNEFTDLAESLSHMAKKLDTKTCEGVEKMQEIITNLNNSSKMLIQRDLELTRANEKLQQLDKMKSEFVSLATHQLRTPLSGVRWSLSMLINGEMGELTPDQKLYVMKTYESNNRMITLINDMLQADRVESGTLKFRFTPTNLVYLFDNILAELREIANKKNITLTLIADDTLPLLTIDPENMRIVLQNLIDNAIKYSHKDGEVKITIVKKDPVVEITFQDKGIGIPKEHQDKIFKRFFRASNAVHSETDGSGLGLYIVESIIQMHHGTIRFESKENEGTTFYVTLPINKNA